MLHVEPSSVGLPSQPYAFGHKYSIYWLEGVSFSRWCGISPVLTPWSFSVLFSRWALSLHLKPGCSCSIVTHNMLWEQMSLSHAISGNDTEEQVLLQNMEIFLDIFWAHRKSQKNINRKPSQDVAAIGQKPFNLWNHESQPVLTLQPCSLMSMPLCMVSFPSGSLLVSSFGKEEMAVIRPEECPARVHPHHSGCQWQSAQPSGRLENYERIEEDGVLGDASILQSFVSGWCAHHADNNFVTRL